MGEFVIRCPECGSDIKKEESFAFTCKVHNALGRSYYVNKKLKIRKYPGLWRYYDWLPVKGVSKYQGKSITYKSDALGKELGLRNIYVSFNGYWPERKALLKTCTFKEIEAAVAIQYAKEHGAERLAIPSAGNTARSFAYIASMENLPLVLIIPYRCLFDIWLPRLKREIIKTIVVKDGDYSDAISLSNRLTGVYGITNEGGVRNVARRDGLATILLDAVQVMGKMPQHYFQAIGTGTGAISVWEGAMRLVESGGYAKPPKMHLAQNLPFAPMVKAWQEDRREIIPAKDIPNVRNVLDLIEARVLSNRYPPYGVTGGVYDVLKSTNGCMYGITNEELKEARRLFQELEGIDIHPAAGVATAALIKAVINGRVSPEDMVLLNVTGGGEKRLMRDERVVELEVDKYVSKEVEITELEEVLG